MTTCHCGIDHHAQPAASAAPIPTLILAILDESGSMAIKRADVIGGFNTFLKEQQAVPGECRLSLIKFNTEKTVVHAALPIKDVAALTDRSYTPGGNTALLDAVAEGIRLADKDKRAADRVLCLVITDGEENSSRETTKDQVLAIVKEREARGDWTFTYLGVAAEKWAQTGVVTGVANASAYTPSNPRASFAGMSASTTAFRNSSETSTKAFYGGDQDKPTNKA